MYLLAVLGMCVEFDVCFLFVFRMRALQKAEFMNRRTCWLPFNPLASLEVKRRLAGGGGPG